jgi:hypothetical protein
MTGFNFKQFFMETVPFNAFKSIRKKIRGSGRRDLQPGTFGIEIEFEFDEDDYRGNDYDVEYDMESAWNDFYHSSDADGPIRVEDWEHQNPEPVEPDEEPEEPDGDSEEYQKWEQEHEKWEEEHQEWEAEHQEWEHERSSVVSEREHWEDYGESEAFDSWFQDNSDDYREGGDIQAKMQDVKASMDYIGIRARVLPSGQKGGKGWNVFEDEGGVIEISSDILTTKDFPLVKKFLELIQDEPLSHDTGAHVHVGTPNYTDAFDLVSVIWMLDEEYLLQYAGREEEDIDNYAKRKETFFDSLYTQLFNGSNHTRKSVTMTNAEFMAHLENHFTRYFGVNAIQAFKKHKTVELRFLSSQIIKDPNRFISFIQYFMALPQLAQKKKELRIKTTYDYRIIRQPGGKVMIMDDLTTKVRQSNLPVVQLRTPEQPVDPNARKQDLLAKYGSLIQKDKRQKQTQAQDQAAIQNDVSQQNPV